ncbi:MAG: hypothetical protein KDD64_03900 [Bdellovibrionales bacterium]|nr:hypothetical protein [Bdellovibrionales bacterium]
MEGMILKAVHSYFFPPIDQHTESRGLGGFPSAREYWYSHALSACLLRQHFLRIELVTDQYGAHVVMNLLKLPYDSVRVLPHSAAGVGGHAWNSIKFLAYLEQDEAFVHCDTDAYLWNPLPREILDSQVFGQSIEAVGDFKTFYSETLEEIRKYLPELPAGFSKFQSDFEGNYAINCGLLGGTDLKLLHYYAKTTLLILHHPKNANGWETLMREGNSDVREQVCAAVEQLNIIVACAKFHVRPKVVLEIGKEHLQGPSPTLTHLMGPTKNDSTRLSKYVELVKREFPQIAGRIETHFGQR